jgi:hypothetical protein
MPTTKPKKRPREQPSAFSYDAEQGTYRRRSTGQYVSRAQIREAIDSAIQKEERELARISRRLAARTITIDEWQSESAQIIKNIHLWNGAAGKGGWGEMTQSDFGKVGARLREQYGYLDNFAQQLERGEVDVRSAGFLTRVEMYAEAGRNTYHSTLLSAMQSAGMTEERNVLYPADHCAGCLEADGEGWVAIGELPLPGERDCLTNCKCDIIYR